MRTSTVYLPTIPGFDGTALPKAPLTVTQLGKWIGEFIDLVIGTKVNLSGHSFGGWVASWVAVLRPDIVERLVLQCPIGFRPQTPPKPDADPATLLARTHAHPERRRPETKSNDVIAGNRKLAATYGNGVVTDSDLIARLGTIEARTLVLHGREDGVVPLESAQFLLKEIPLSTLVVLDDAAHNIEVDQPDDYARLVRNFLTVNQSESR